MPPKRKAKDAASPLRPSASRARSTRTSKSLPVTDDNESEGPSSRPAKRARGAASRASNQNDEVDDDFGDYGRGTSKPATIEQHLIDQNKKSKAFIQVFKERVAQGRERAEETLGKLKQDLVKPQLSGTDNVSEIYTALQTAAAQTLSTKDNPLFAQTQHLLRLSRAILKCHQTVQKDSSTPHLASPRETWEQDGEGMRKLLEYGKTYGEKVVEGWITPGDKCKEVDGEGEESSGDDEEEKRSEAENLARGLFEWKKRKERLLRGEESWGVVARRQMIALAGVVRTLPPNKGK